MAKYNSYIELSPHYESVVDIDSESRHPDMWQEYIVHEDMKGAIEKICDSMKYEDDDKRRSFWIHGAYGTGKSYAAIVLKHLFEDKVDSIRKFLSNQMLIPYRELGEVQGFDAQVVADAGIIVLGNINASRFNVNENMMEEVSSVFSESASLDRFHGFIPGWEIPRMHQGLVANGWALNTEYFAEVLHLLRDDLTYTTIVDECLAVPAKPDKRDLTAIKRLCTAFVKLLYPNATCKEDIPADEFIKYCLEPAKEMRSVIKKQLCIIDPKEFNVPGKKDIPDIQYNYL